MPGKGLSMRKIYEIIHLTYECGCSNRDIGLSCIIGSSIVSYSYNVPGHGGYN